MLDICLIFVPWLKTDIYVTWGESTTANLLHKAWSILLALYLDDNKINHSPIRLHVINNTWEVAKLWVRSVYNFDNVFYIISWLVHVFLWIKTIDMHLFLLLWFCGSYSEMTAHHCCSYFDCISISCLIKLI